MTGHDMVNGHASSKNGKYYSTTKKPLQLYKHAIQMFMSIQQDMSPRTRNSPGNILFWFRGENAVLDHSHGK